jgi:hypothetical protein
MNVLYLIFNRPHLQSDSFSKIRAMKPKRLFVAADGPRPNRRGEDERCIAARKIIEKVDWDCDVKTLFRETNVGCRINVGNAITWFFRHVEDGIIIEDDCVTSEAFLDLASKLLDYYRYDHRVWCISATNFQKGVRRGDGSYYFSQYNHCWSWASWRRCWVHYDDALLLWARAEQSGVTSKLFDSAAERAYWRQIWNDLTDPSCKIDSWAYRWACAVTLNGGLTILPNANLVENIGFAGEGTHCFGDNPYPGIQEFDATIKHPSFVLRDREADQFTFEHVFGGRRDMPIRVFTSKVRRRVKRILKALKTSS